MNTPLLDAAGNLYVTPAYRGPYAGAVIAIALGPTTVTTLASSANPAMAGSAVTLTSLTVQSPTLPFPFPFPTLLTGGTVTFSNGVTTLGTSSLVSGNATLTLLADSIGVGTATITATYAPSSPGLTSSSATLSQTVQEPGVVLTRGDNALTGNQTVTGNVTVTGTVTASAFIGDGSQLRNLPGVIGPTGPQGLTGATGPQGLIGPQGDAGSSGAPGAVGPQGPQGVAGPQGQQGVGPIGPQGIIGPIGPQGVIGPIGPQGEGLFSGSLLMLPTGSPAPANYTFVGTFILSSTAKKNSDVTVDLYRRK